MDFFQTPRALFRTGRFVDLPTNPPNRQCVYWAWDTEQLFVVTTEMVWFEFGGTGGPHTHDAADVVSGIFDLARIPDDLVGKNADTLDGMEAADFAPAVHTHAHNDTTGIQGGVATEYYHLSNAQHTLVTGTRSANTVFAGPTSGGAALPTWRAMVAADLPAMTAATTVAAGTQGAVPAPPAGSSFRSLLSTAAWVLNTIPTYLNEHVVLAAYQQIVVTKVEFGSSGEIEVGTGSEVVFV